MSVHDAGTPSYFWTRVSFAWGSRTNKTTSVSIWRFYTANRCLLFEYWSLCLATVLVIPAPSPTCALWRWRTRAVLTGNANLWLSLSWFKPRPSHARTDKTKKAHAYGSCWMVLLTDSSLRSSVIVIDCCFVTKKAGILISWNQRKRCIKICYVQINRTRPPLHVSPRS